MEPVLSAYEVGIAETIKHDFIYTIVKTIDDPNCKNVIRRVCISSYDFKPIMGYLKDYFDTHGYKIEYKKVDRFNYFSIVVIDIIVTKTEKSHLPLYLKKIYKKIANIPLGKGSKEEDEEPFNTPRLMSADEARDIADKKNLENQFSLDHYLLLIGEAIGKAAKEGKYSVDFNLEYNTNTEVINKLSSYLKSLGFTVNEDTSWNSSDGYYKKLTIEFYSK